MSEPARPESLRTTLAVFDAGAPGEPRTTSEVTEHLDVSRRSTYERLDRLADRNLLETKKVGARGRVWWRPVAPATDPDTERATDGGTERADGGTERADSGPETADDSTETADGGTEVVEGVASEGRSEEQAFSESILDNQRDVVYMFDAQGAIRKWNDRLTEVTGYTDAEIAGANPLEFVGQEGVDRAAAAMERVLAGESATIEVPLETADGETIPYEFTGSPVTDESGEVVGMTGIGRDVSDRKRTERELQRRRDELAAELTAVFDRVDDAFFALDDEWRFTHVNERAASVLDRSAGALVGQHIWTAFPEARGSKFQDAYERAFDSQETVAFEAYFDPLDAWFEVRAYPSESGLSVYFRDVTERKERERALERRVRQGDAVADLGQRALEDRDVEGLMADAAGRVADALDADYCKVLDLDADTDELLLRHGVGWDDGIVGAATVSAVDDDSQAAHTLASAEPVVVEDLATESRFSGPDLLTGHDVRSGISVVVGPPDDPWGILGVHDTAVRAFTDQDVAFVQSVANVLATAITRRDDERALVRQREQLAALNSLNEVVREISDAVIDQSTREEIEAVVCDRLAAADSYEFAWIGEVDHATQEVVPRADAEAGDYLEAVTVSVDQADERSGGPGGRALRTGETQTTQDVRNDPRHAPWRDLAEAHGYRSSAAIPIVHEGTTYGMLGVYADRPYAFTDEERAVVEQLGELIGHAIAAVERKRALMSDEVVELGFHVQDVFETVGAESVDGTITVDETVPIADDDYLAFGTVTSDATGALHDFVDRLPHWTSVTIRDGDETESDAEETAVHAYELRLSDPPVLSTVASLGGTIAEAVIEDGAYRMTVQLPPGSAVRRVIDTVQEAYPAAEMVTRRQTTRESDGGGGRALDVDERLTDRQRAALRAAYHAGFFEWPRAASGEDVAASLDVSAPTFHQHLRRAEQTVFESLLSTE